LQQTTCWQSQFCAGLCQLIHSLHSNSIEYILIREDLPAFFPEGHTSILDSFQSFVFIDPDRSIVMMRISNKFSRKRNDFHSSRYIESQSFCEINMLVRELFRQGQHCRWLAFIVVKTDFYCMADGKRILSKSQSSSGRTKLLTPHLTREIRNDQPLTREVCSRK